VIVYAIINDAIEKKQFFIRYPDCRDAFVNEKHDLTQNNLTEIIIACQIINFITNSYHEEAIHIQTRDCYPEKMNIIKSVEHGCPLHSTLFKIVIELLIRNFRGK
jgi:hypothetical protein